MTHINFFYYLLEFYKYLLIKQLNNSKLNRHNFSLNFLLIQTIFKVLTIVTVLFIVHQHFVNQGLANNL